MLQNDPETSKILSQPPLISFKRDKNIGKFLVSSAFLTNDQPGTFKCARAQCKTCPFIRNAEKISGSKRSVNITDRFNFRDVEKDDKDAFKPVARHFNFPNHTEKQMSVCGLSLHQGSTESRKTLEEKFIFQIGTLNPHGINERFSFN